MSKYTKTPEPSHHEDFLTICGELENAKAKIRRLEAAIAANTVEVKRTAEFIYLENVIKQQQEEILNLNRARELIPVPVQPSARALFEAA